MKHFCPNVPIILVGNKKDLRNDEHTRRELAKMKQVRGFTHFVTVKNKSSHNVLTVHVPCGRCDGCVLILCLIVDCPMLSPMTSSLCFVFVFTNRSLSRERRASTWPIRLVHSATWSARLRQRTVCGRSSKWPPEQRYKLAKERQAEDVLSSELQPLDSVFPQRRAQK